jgi:hypothetical protein
MQKLAVHEQQQYYDLPNTYTETIIQGGASEWRVHSKLIFENLKPVEKSKNHNNII